MVTDTAISSTAGSRSSGHKFLIRVLSGRMISGPEPLLLVAGGSQTTSPRAPEEKLTYNRLDHSLGNF